MSRPNYTARTATVDGFEVARLADAAARTEVSIARTFGNNAYEMKVNGKNLLWSPFTLKQLRARPEFVGIPLMAPWANRLDWDGFHVNGRRYALKPELGNFLRDGNGYPIHGLLAFSPDWELVAAEADGQGARVTSRLEFGRHPSLMAQFPFAHAVEMTHRLRDGVLEVETRLENQGDEPMPVSLGYHPFFRIHDAPRAAWRVTIPARAQMLVSDEFLPTGRTAPLDLPASSPLPALDPAYIFSSLRRETHGGAEFRLEGEKERITVVQGPRFGLSVFYAPPDGDFVCFEPMAATVNALNPAKDGRWHRVEKIRPGGSWQESFWIQPSGF